MSELSINNNKIFLQKIIEGDPEAESYLLNHYQDKIAWYIRKKIGYHQENWQDLFNDTLLAVFENIKNGKYDPKKGELGSYIYGIAKNKIRDFFKEKKQKKSEKLIEEDIKDPVNPENWEKDQQSKEQKAILRVLLKKLKPKYQEVLYLRYYKDLSMKKIGAEINRTEQQVINLHNYALKKVRKTCEKKKLFSIFLVILLIYI